MSQQAKLDPRAREVLRQIIAIHILTGEPVGSRTVAKSGAGGLSPASIRNVMADLEDLGLLSHPHTSAGRVPTDRGYRLYVDALVPSGRLPAADKALIDHSLAGIGGELGEAMEVIPRLLSRLTRHIGCFVSPPIGDAVLKHIEFVKLHERRILTVFVDRTGVVSHRILEAGQEYSQEDLDRAGRYLTSEFEGQTLRQIRTRLIDMMVEEKATFDRLLKNAITLGSSYLDAESGHRKVIVEGTANILKVPELADAGTMHRLFETFEEKHRLVTLIDRCLDQAGVRVVIGRETDDPALDSLSFVVSQYSLGEQASGSIGVVGPTRMEYERAIALVGYISRLLSGLLTRQQS